MKKAHQSARVVDPQLLAANSRQHFHSSQLPLAHLGPPQSDLLSEVYFRGTFLLRRKGDVIIEVQHENFVHRRTSIYRNTIGGLPGPRPSRRIITGERRVRPKWIRFSDWRVRARSTTTGSYDMTTGFFSSSGRAGITHRLLARCWYAKDGTGGSLSNIGAGSWIGGRSQPQRSPVCSRPNRRCKRSGS
jgi:hypothetical protein